MDITYKKIYADVAKYFTIVGALAFLVINFYLDIFKYFIGDEYWGGLAVVPVLLMANLFLGLYYNISIWYKLTDQTSKGGIIAVGGATVTILLNLWWIPILGYVGSAWATLICYFSMTLASWAWGKKYYPVNYDLKRILFYIFFSLALFVIGLELKEVLILSQQWVYTVNSLLLAAFLFVTWQLERNTLLTTP